MNDFVHRVLPLALLLLAGSSAIGIGCSKTTTPSAGGNSNWLMACEADDDCDDGHSCICGRCTSDCTTDEECAPFGAGATCETASVLSSECDDRGACVLSCTAATECVDTLGSGAVCEDALCRPAADAGTMGQAPRACQRSEECEVGQQCLEGMCVEQGDASIPIDVCPACSDGAQCVSGECRPITAEDTRIGELSATATHLLWARGSTYDDLGNLQADGAIVAVSRDEAGDTQGDPVVRAGGQRDPRWLVAQDGYLYWLDGSPMNTRIQRIALETGAPEVLVEGQERTGCLGVGATHVYWSHALDGTLTRAPKDGSGTPELVVTLPGAPSVDGIVERGPYLYWIEEGRLARCLLDACEPESVIEWSSNSRLRTDESALYWVFDDTAGLSVVTPSEDEREMIHLGHAGEEQGQYSFLDLAVGDSDLYWAFGNDATGSVERLDKAPGQPTVLLSGPDLAGFDTHLAAQGNRAWISLGRTRIVELP